MDSIPLNIELPSEFSKCELDITTLKALKGDQGFEDGEIIGRLEDTILKHFRAIAFYQGHINVRKRGINIILPREVLSEVFYLIARHDFTIASDNSEPPRLSWLELAHVCRYWRNIVLTSPRIFSSVYLPAENQERLQTCLYYSRQAPLDVICCDNLNQVDRQKWLYNQWLTLHPHLSHTRTLTLRTQLADTTETALVLPLSTTLTRLTLKDPFVRVPPQYETAGRAIDQIFNALPNLLHLTSDPYTLGQSDWTERAFPVSLQTLIVDNPFGEEPTPSLSHLISALQKLTSLRQLEFRGLRSEDFPGSHTISMARIHPLESLHLDGHGDPCTSFLSSTDSTHRLFAQPTLHICDNPLAMDIFLDSLTGLLERQCLPSEESYVLVNSARSTLGDCTLKTRLKVRPMGNSLVVPCKTICKTLHNRRGPTGPGRFSLDITAIIIETLRRDENWESMILRWASPARDFYRRILPVFLHVRALVVVLDADGYTARCAWDAIAPLSNVQTLQIVVPKPNYIHKNPDARFHISKFPLNLCEIDGQGGLDNGQVLFPSLRILSVCAPLLGGGASRTFVENLRIALEARKARGHCLMKLVLNVWKPEKDQLEEQFRPLVEILSTEEEPDCYDLHKNWFL